MAISKRPRILSKIELQQELYQCLKEEYPEGIELSSLETDLAAIGIEATLQEIVDAVNSLKKQGKVELFLEVEGRWNDNDYISVKIRSI